MTFWPWSKELEVGIGEIDEQHKWLVDLTNQLHDALEGGAEDLFLRLGYPETDAHKAEHNKFTGQIMNLIERHENGDSAGEKTLELLKDWLTHHILKVDKAYVDHFRANGIS